MQSNCPAEDRQRFPALAGSFRRAKKIGTREIRDRMWREAALPPPPPPDPERSHAALEELTAAFRADLARKHRTKVREGRAMMRTLQRAWCPTGGHVPAVVLEDRDLMGAPPSDLNPRLLSFSSPIVTPDGEVLEGAELTRSWVDLMRKAASSVRWHDGRDRGQIKRFETVRSCGSRIMIAQCQMCEHKRDGVPEGCGVSRVCEKCSLQKAKKRRGRFGRGRGRVLLRSARAGLTKQARTNGRFTEKMLTVTVPHVTRAECTGLVAEHAKDDVQARVLAAYLAWPLFLRRLNYHLSGERESRKAKALRLEAVTIGGAILTPAGKLCAITRAGERRLKKAKRLDRKAGGRRMDRPFVTYHRAFEWTAGDDGKGHPHYHIHLWSTFLPGKKLHAWWADALRAVGVPVRRVPAKKATLTTRVGDLMDQVVVELRMLRTPNQHAVFELMKGGRRSALELSRLDFAHGSSSVASVGLSGAVFRKGPGLDAYHYAEGWTIAEALEMCDPAIVASLYMSLEGRRLSQASRGFFEEDPPCECTHCGAEGCFTVDFKSIAELPKDHPLAAACAHDLDHLREAPS